MVKGILENFLKIHHISRKRDMKSPIFYEDLGRVLVFFS